MTSTYNLFILAIIAVKVIYVSLAVYGRLRPSNERITYWKDRVEFIFITMMTVLILFVFNPRKPMSFTTHYVERGETRLLLFLFGFILILTAKWNTFFSESKWMSTLLRMFGNEGSR